MRTLRRGAGAIRYVCQASTGTWLGLLLLLCAPAAHAAIPFNELWRLALLNQCVGFACATLQAIQYASTYDLCTVTTLADSGAGSLRSCAESANSYWIVFNLSGTITVNNAIRLKSNKVLDGRGADITFTTSASFPYLTASWASQVDNTLLQVGHYTELVTTPVTNIIITNFKFQNCTVNAMVLVSEYANTVWLDHFTMQHSTDEHIAVSCMNPPGLGNCRAASGGNRAPDNVSVSYMKSLQRNIALRLPDGGSDCCVPGHNSPCPGFYTWCSKSFLVGSFQANESQISITAHHNWYATDARHPAMDRAQFHAFNNWYDGSQAGVNANNTNICDVSKFVSEFEVVDKGTSPGYESDPTIAGDATFCVNGPNTSSITCTNDVFLNGASCGQINTGTNFTPSSFYSYTPHSTTGLTALLQAQTGWQNVQRPPAGLAAPQNLRVIAITP